MNQAEKQPNRLFMEMYDSYSNELFKFALSQTRNRDTALDVVQDTFVKTWDYIRNGNEIEKARPFLYRTVRNLIIDAGRKKKTASLDAILDADIPHDIADETDEPAVDIDRKMAIEKLKLLPAEHYEILSLRYIQELTISEIAAIYKQTENAISVRIHRALKSAKSIFSDAETYEP